MKTSNLLLSMLFARLNVRLQRKLAGMLICLAASPLYAQHHPSPEKGASTSLALHFSPVLSQRLKDPELKNYQMLSQLMEVPASFTDTVAHRHDSELFGYVLEGDVEIQLGGRSVTRFSAGQMFYEPRNVLHQLLRNPSDAHPARVLLIFVIKDGRQSYKREYPAPVAGK
jgi:mannose-6-phosphate isomerase-like protein (cupin superfamily)